MIRAYRGVTPRIHSTAYVDETAQVVGEDCIIAAGALLTEGMQVPAGSLVMGSPAKVTRPLTASEIASIKDHAERYVRYRVEYMGPT